MNSDLSQDVSAGVDLATACPVLAAGTLRSSAPLRHPHLASETGEQIVMNLK